MKGRRIDVDGQKESPVKEVTKAPKAPATDFFDMVDGLGGQTKAPDKKADKKVAIDLPANLKLAVDQVVSWKKKEKEAKAERETLEQQIIDFVSPIQEEHGFGNCYQKSYRIHGKTETVTYVTSDRFSGVTSDDVAQLQNVLGERFDEFVSKKMEMKLTPQIWDQTPQGQALREELMAYIPKDAFGKFFQKEVSYSWVDGFDMKRFNLPKKIYDVVKNFFRQAKPSLR